MLHRFFSEQAIDADTVVLRGPEAHHLLHVFRASVGTEVILFDGKGDEFLARVSQQKRQEVHLEIARRIQADRELAFPMTIAAALPKGERQRFLVEKLVELGATCFVPLTTRRSVAKSAKGSTTRLSRTVVEASKQCGRNRSMTIAEGESFEQFIYRAPADAVRWLAQFDGEPVNEASVKLSRDESLRSHGVFLMVGPEGGFQDDEIGLATAAGWTPISLGSRTLRVETAAITLASYWAIT